MTNNQNLPKANIQIIEKLKLAFSTKDYSKLSVRDLFQLVDSKLIHPSTAKRLCEMNLERNWG